ncbi:transmembrane GTPase fzo-like [Asterias amurensis]|uniref:transmembrane GTPase fzo-like n=1 Tax=Asterias amurensis TaxID=7602 RepID=UPI003AB694D7
MANSAVDVRNRRFAEAKELMKTIYETEKNFVQSMVDIVANKDFPQKWGFEILKEMGEKIKSICKIIGRGKMKAVFFGMTSSGKSALINTLLRDNVLPSLCGETTSAFITVEGTDEPNEYAEDVKGSRIKIEDIGKRSSVLESGKMSCDKITVYWPKRKCGLLKNELVVVDCPGTCTSSDTDDQVTEYCVDADIYIFVVNSISSLNEAACKFFEEVARRFSKPNVLAVFTMWDMAQQMMDEQNRPESLDHLEDRRIAIVWYDLTIVVNTQEKVRGQHQQRATELLKDKLGVVETDEDAAERIFFTAPIEILKKDKGSLLKDWQEREKEFYRFEGTFKV